MPQSLATDRRRFLKLGAGTTGAWLLAGPVSQAVAASCGVATPPQTPGPFYPGESKIQPEHDLTRVAGHAQRADGQVVYIRGKVLDRACNPVAGAIVEIWQACASGRYNNSKDPNPAPIDPHFGYWGEAQTDTGGEYWFKTIIPGAYPADVDWVRPPHIHFKVSRVGFHELVTQMYFKGNPLNESDLILQQIPAGQREGVVVEFMPSAADLEPGTLSGVFDIILKSVR